MAAAGEVRGNLQFLFGVLSRWRWFLLVFVGVVTAVAFVVVQRLPPRYQAQTQIVLQAPASTSPMAAAPLALLGGGGGVNNETEVAILTSLNLADQVIERLDLTHKPYFNPDAHRSDDFWSRLLGRGQQADRPLAEVKAAVTDRYLQSLSVHAGDRSRAVDIAFVADNPQLAADLANSLAEVYIDDQIRAHRQAMAQESDWLTDHVEELRQRVSEAQRRLEQFKSQHGVLDANGGTFLDRQIVDYNQQLTTTQIGLAQAEERARQLERLGRQDSAAESTSSAIDSPILQRLRDEEMMDARQVAELSVSLRDGHPRLGAAKAQLESVRGKITIETRRLIDAAENQVTLSREQESALKARLDDLNRQYQGQVASSETLKVLEVDLKTTTEMYGAMLNRLREASALDDRVDAARARVISPAAPVNRPIAPRKGPLVVGAAAGATMVGLLMAFLLEYLDVGFRTRRQIEEATGMETVASLPELKDVKQTGRAEIAGLLKANPSFVEAIRYARVSLCLAPDPDRAVRGILVTSALPGEGKSFVSTALGLSFAGGGTRTVTVDCDLRRSTPAEGPGLAQLLLGTATLDACLREDKTTGLHHLPAGQVEGLIDPPQLLASPQMRALYQQLTARFEVVVLDTPPVKLFPDALIVQQLVDKVFFLVRWAKTRREVSVDALKTIVQCGHFSPVVGLTLVDFRQLPRFDYAARVPKQIRPLMRM
jgi:uncharacterized protein involved in exopolysaccharide biosynthesis/Mrp family chromosome partitioning ATPase